MFCLRVIFAKGFEFLLWTGRGQAVIQHFCLFIPVCLFTAVVVKCEEIGSDLSDFHR